MPALSFHNCNNLQLTGTCHLNSARNHISINNSNLTEIFNITAPKDSPNIDGIDISESCYILIQHSTIATGDDCIAINSGASCINIIGVTCGPGHVKHVHVTNFNFKGTDKGRRIKTWPGGCGYAGNISFEHIVLINTKNRIIIDQDYESEQKEDRKQTSEVQISGVTYRYVNGTSDGETAINLNCGGGAGAGCTDIFMDVVNITSASSGSNVLASCNNAHGVAASTSPPVSCLS
ncbi:putative polygalacturonase [Glycine max]|nr:putative polygalacturonase [Glycine max]